MSVERARLVTPLRVPEPNLIAPIGRQPFAVVIDCETVEAIGMLGNSRQLDAVSRIVQGQAPRLTLGWHSLAGNGEPLSVRPKCNAPLPAKWKKKLSAL